MKSKRLISCLSAIITPTIFLLALCFFASCNDDEHYEIALDLGLSESYSMTEADTLEISFSLTSITGKGISAEATVDNSEFTVETVLDETNLYEGIVKVITPSVIFESISTTLTVTVEDTGNGAIDTKTASIIASSPQELSIITDASNCYIVEPGVRVKFPASIGGSTEVASYDEVSLLWQDVYGLVSSVHSATDGIWVILNENVTGNAVIQAKASDIVVWSWHLWVCDYDPASNVMTVKDDSENQYTFMDRYIGATSAEVGVQAANGNFFQWGRKDPFPTSNFSNEIVPVYDISGNEVEITVEAVDAENNITNAIQNPTVSYSGVSAGNYSWISSTTKDYTVTSDLWGDESNEKSIYDPCPYGWKVPTIDAYSFYSSSSLYPATLEKVYSDENDQSNANLLGRTAEVDGVKFWFPAQGEIAHSGSGPSSVGSTWPCAKTWAASVDTENYRGYAAGATPSSTTSKQGFTFGYRLPVRCIKEN